jgi:ankyrin repeat protein
MALLAHLNHCLQFEIYNYFKYDNNNRKKFIMVSENIYLYDQYIKDYDKHNYDKLKKLLKIEHDTILDAVKNKDILQVNNIINYLGDYINPFEVDGDGKNILMFDTRDDIYDKILDKYGRVLLRQVDNIGNNVLMYALMNGYKLGEKIIDQYKQYIDPNLMNDKNENILIIALKYKNKPEIINQLLKSFKFNINDSDIDGNNALIYSIKYKYTNIALKIMNNYDCNYDQINSNNDTALLLSTKNELHEISKILIGKEEDILPYHQDNDGHHALMFLNDPLFFDFIDKYPYEPIDVDESNSVLLHAFLNNKINIIQTLISERVERTYILKYVDDDGDHILTKMILMNNHESANMIIDNIHEQIVDQINDDKILLLLCNNKYENGELALKIIKKYKNDCLLAGCDSNGDTVLTLAIKNKMIDVMDELLSLDCAPHSRNKKMNTPLLLLCGDKYNNKEFALKIIKKYKNDCLPMATDLDGNTALMLAIKNDMFNVIDELLFLDCMPHSQNSDGEFALMIAIDNKMENTVMQLLDRFGNEFDPFLKNKQGKTPFQLAYKYKLLHAVIKMIDIYGIEKCIL